MYKLLFCFVLFFNVCLSVAIFVPVAGGWWGWRCCGCWPDAARAPHVPPTPAAAPWPPAAPVRVTQRWPHPSWLAESQCTHPPTHVCSGAGTPRCPPRVWAPPARGCGGCWARGPYGSRSGERCADEVVAGAPRGGPDGWSVPAPRLPCAHLLMGGRCVGYTPLYKYPSPGVHGHYRAQIMMQIKLGGTINAL